jgi:hypothetical protein
MKRIILAPILSFYIGYTKSPFSQVGCEDLHAIFFFDFVLNFKNIFQIKGAYAPGRKKKTPVHNRAPRK